MVTYEICAVPEGPRFSLFMFLGAFRAGGTLYDRDGEGDGAPTPARRPGESSSLGRFWNNWFSGRSAVQDSTMILPQVHLRKPCYDFSFL